jgi:hypothetical protein
VRCGTGRKVREGEEALGVEFCSMFEPHLTNWRVQYERMRRGFERLNQPYRSAVEYQDDLQHFLQDSWHLKDWIKNDTGSGIDKQLIEREVQGYPALMVAADLATACKHLNHDKKSWADAYATRKDLTVHLGQDRGIDVVYYITARDGQTTEQPLISDVVAAWDDLLRKLGLI